MSAKCAVTAAVLFLTVFCFTGRVIAGGSGGKGTAVSSTSPEAVPAYLKPISADLPATVDQSAPSSLTIDIPQNGSIYPPEIIPPQFAWRDDSAAAVWQIEITFGDQRHPVKLWVNGERMQIAPADESLVGYVPPILTPEQTAAHTWRPDAKTWEAIKRHSTEVLAIVSINGYASKKNRARLSHAEATFQTSKDPVGAPIFYRDVPLIPPDLSTTQRGVIKPLPDSVLPKIKWELRSINELQSKVVMTGLPTCGNCHSFSRDGSTLGIDMDGPANDKGLYALIPVKKVSTISNDYLIHWSAFSEEHAQKRFGFMSQLSPDGRFVVNSIDVPHAHGLRVLDRLYNGFYPEYGFGQVFYPTRGVLAWYSRETGRLNPLPGADDPDFVQTSAFWSPDGKWLVFSRAPAKDPYPPDYKRSMYANDPNETQIQYDLYRIPFNNGNGGTPEKIVGASENGMSNNFPKVSPDGKWIIYVQCKNGLLMRPDSKLYIVPFEGGVARPLQSNLPVMNSWHTFSPNGHWLAFSSKTPSLYTHLYLTHIDDQGNASPPVVVENATASNRAVNIPEFVALGPEGLDRIDTPAIDFYREFDAAQQLQDTHKFSEAIPAWRVAAAKDPSDPRPYNNMGVALAATGNTSGAIEEYKKSLALNDDVSQTHNNLGTALAESGQMEDSMAQIKKAIELNPDNGSAHINLGHILEVMGGHRQDAIDELTRGIGISPKSSDGHNIYGVILARMGKLDEAVVELQTAVDLAPQSAECRFNLGRAWAAKGKFAEALTEFEAAASLTGGKEPAILQMLAGIYSETGQYQKAIDAAQHALEQAVHQQNNELAAALRGNIARYRSQVQQQR